MHLWPEIEGNPGSDPTDHHVRRTAGPVLAETDEHEDFPRSQFLATTVCSYFGEGLQDGRVFAREDALNLGFGRSPYKDGVHAAPGADQCLLEAFCEHQHGCENKHHESHSPGGQKGRQAADPQVPIAVTDQDEHAFKRGRGTVCGPTPADRSLWPPLRGEGFLLFIDDLQLIVDTLEFPDVFSLPGDRSL